MQNLPGPYYAQAADPLEHELRQMGDEFRQEDIDGVVDRLTAAVEVRLQAIRVVSSCCIPVSCCSWSLALTQAVEFTVVFVRYALGICRS